MKFIVAVLLLLLPLPGFSQSQGPDGWRSRFLSGATFSAVRKAFLGQNVVVAGGIFRGGLIYWSTVRKGGDGRYEATRVMDEISSAYSGKTAIVISVQLGKSQRQDLRPNALGETASEDDIVNPLFDLVVRFDDGTLAITSAYPSSLGSRVEFASIATSFAEQMSKELPLLVGKTVYAVEDSTLYQADTTLDEITGSDPKGKMKRLLSRTPLLQPLTILAAKSIDEGVDNLPLNLPHDAGCGVIFKLKLPSGEEALAFTAEDYYLSLDSLPFADRVIGNLDFSIPYPLTEQEVDAIRHRTLFKGMTKDAAHYFLGDPDALNNWGLGGKQLIYYGGRLLVYLDKDNKVEDWQSFEKK